MGRYEIGSVVFGNWTIKRKLGEGSFGKVFEIQRQDFGEVYRAALKIITVPQSQAEVQSAMEEGMTRTQAEAYFYGVVEDIVREFAIMAKLKGTANVVGYEDHAVVRHPDGIGWDILIRMELLNPLLPYAYAHPFARRDIIRLGIDICRALELCQKYNVIHRDIKPENIFVSDNGDFKLGDFGIARTIDRTMSGLSKKGTYNYMAPEVYRGGDYGFSVDIYSLGIVLYRMLNKNRVPFLPPAPEPITFRNRELSLAKRMGGEEIPAPFHAQGRLAEIVLKACAFDPKERYTSPAQMRQELEAILYDAQDAQLIYPDGDELNLAENQYASQDSRQDTADEDKTASVFGSGASTADSYEASRTQGMFGGAIEQEDATSRTESIFGKTPIDATPSGKPKKEKKKKSGKWMIVAAVVLALCAIGGILENIDNRERKNQSEYEALMESAAACCQSDSQTAIELLQQAQELNPEAVEPKITLAYALYYSGDYSRCITYIEDDLALGKEFGISEQNRLSEILGAAYFEQEDYAAAASFFRLSTAGGEITANAMRDYAVALGKLGDFQAADEVLQRMADAGVDDTITHYVQAEVAYAREDYVGAESGFSAVLQNAKDATLQKRALYSLAEVYRDCTVLKQKEASPIENPAVKSAEVLADGIVRFGLQYDIALQEKLAYAYFEAYRTDGASEDYLEKSAETFRTVLDQGGQKANAYCTLYTIFQVMKRYEDAKTVLTQYQEAYPRDYRPHALRGILYVAIEAEKSQDQRNYTQVQQEYELAGELLRSDDDMTYYQMLESLMEQLRDGGWL